MRTRKVLEDMARNTLSLRLARSSKQATAASALLQAYAAQSRAAAADSMRFAAEERAATLLRSQGAMAGAAHRLAVVAELAKEETAKQVAQRQAAARSQRDALSRALRDMQADEEELLQRIMEQQRHAEEAFLAQHVETMDPRTAGRGGGADPTALLQERIASAVNTDMDPGRVGTLRRVGGLLDSRQGELQERARGINATVKKQAHDVAETVQTAEDMSAEALAATGDMATMRARQEAERAARIAALRVKSGGVAATAGIAGGSVGGAAAGASSVLPPPLPQGHAAPAAAIM